MKELVTKQWLSERLKRSDANRVVGRALAAIYARQTDSEQASTTTKLNNGAGFSKPDARIGSIGARMFLSKGELADWQMKIWMTEKNGYPRICKYAGQLNEVALLNRQRGCIRAASCDEHNESGYCSVCAGKI